MSTQFKILSDAKCFGGRLLKCEHFSDSTKTMMKYRVFLPKEAENKKVPLILWLSGLTCTEDNFFFKSGCQRICSDLGVAIVGPDTSPRGLDLPKEHEHWDFGSGAGYYVNSTNPPWNDNYNMFDYINHDLPISLKAEFESSMDFSKASVMGHSMGGLGSLLLFLAQHHAPTSESGGKKGAWEGLHCITAFSPISNPVLCQWGRKAFGNYLGENEKEWEKWDPCHIVKSYSGEKSLHIMVEQGKDDEYLKEQLLTPNLEEAIQSNDKITGSFNYRDGYDHSYWFVMTFLEEAIKKHVDILNK